MADPRVRGELRERLIRENIEASVALGMSEREARDIAVGMFEEAVLRAQESGEIDIAPGLGDRVLVRKDTDPETRALYEKVRAEGVTDEDIRRWYNMSAVEQEMLFLQDTAARIAVISYHTDQGRSEDEALNIARKAFPVYGDPEDTTHGSGDDRPLPAELKFRVMSFVEGAAADPEAFRHRAESCSSFNAFVRSEMRAGRFPVADSGGPPAATSPTVPYQSSKGSGCLLSLFAMCWQALSGR